MIIRNRYNEIIVSKVSHYDIALFEEWLEDQTFYGSTSFGEFYTKKTLVLHVDSSTNGIEEICEYWENHGHSYEERERTYMLPLTSVLSKIRFVHDSYTLFKHDLDKEPNNQHLSNLCRGMKDRLDKIKLLLSDIHVPYSATRKYKIESDFRQFIDVIINLSDDDMLEVLGTYKSECTLNHEQLYQLYWGNTDAVIEHSLKYDTPGKTNILEIRELV